MKKVNTSIMLLRLKLIAKINASVLHWQQCSEKHFASIERENIMSNYPMQLRMSDLRLGDTVNCFDGSFGTGIVKQITENSVIVFRPYGTCADFSMSSGVICYTEIEEIPYLKS